MGGFSKPEDLRVRIDVFGVKNDLFAIGVGVGIGNDHPFMAVVAFPYERLPLLDTKKLFHAPDSTYRNLPGAAAESA